MMKYNAFLPHFESDIQANTAATTRINKKKGSTLNSGKETGAPPSYLRWKSCAQVSAHLMVDGFMPFSIKLKILAHACLGILHTSEFRSGQLNKLINIYPRDVFTPQTEALQQREHVVISLPLLKTWVYI